MMSKMTKKRRVVIILCVLLAVGIVALCIEFVPIYRGEFSPGRLERHPTMRDRMVEDMEQEIDIWNLSRDEIIEIIGPKDPSYLPPDRLSYLIGGSIFGKYYVINFGEDGRVIDIYSYID